MRPVRGPNLVLWLPLYQIDGASFGSRDAYGHLCTPSPTAGMWTPQGYKFDGIDDWVQANSLPVLGNADRTLEVVVMFTGSGEWNVDTALWVGTGGERACIFIGRLTAAKTFFMGFWADDLETSIPAVDNQWYHLLGTYRGATRTANLFVNGQLIGTRILGGDINTDGTSAIGASTKPDRRLKGIVSEACVFSRALSSPEILNHYLDCKRRMPWLT